FKEQNYLCDTHTAVGVKVYYDYREKTSDETPTVIASTANPFKFSKAVLEAVEGSVQGLDEFSMVERLAEVTGKECPAPLANLRNKAVRFTNCCEKDSDSMKRVIFDMLSI
ncbi:MAG: threonine synthase, partial [Clostridia bacterium]|nr:threonine synthase [Clostridia bacterium]